MAVTAYLLLLPGEKDQGDLRAEAEVLAAGKGLRVDNYMTVEMPALKAERKRRMDELFSSAGDRDVVIISDLCRVGNNVAEIVDAIGTLPGKGARLIAVRQHVDLGGPSDARSKAAAAVFSMLSGLGKELASARIRNALAEKRKAGVTLGRPKGSISASKLDDKKDLIIEYLSKGVSKASLARILDTSPSNLLSYLKTRKIEVKEKERQRAAAAAAPKTVLHPIKNSDNDAGPADDAAIKQPVQRREYVNHIEEVKEVVLCRHCGKNILDPRTTSCAGGYIDYQDNESHRRIPYPEDEKERCPRCGVEPGGYHHDGCYMERCPRCGERLVSCACKKV